MMKADLTAAIIGDLLDRALTEDLGGEGYGPCDLTSEAVIPEDLRFRGVMAAREPMVVAGLPIAEAAFRRLVPDCGWIAHLNDGDRVEAGGVIAEIEGQARGLLSAERVALNTLQHLSGIATLTRAYVDRIAGTGAVLLDTRKTIPGLRIVEKYATRMGGAQNHRLGLYDGVMIKDNHIAVCGSIRDAVERAKMLDLPNIEVECDTLEQVAEAVAAGADIILLDNMNADQLRQAVDVVAKRAKTEASGGVRLETIRALAETGVDYVSVGRITQSAPAVDIGLDWKWRD